MKAHKWTKTGLSVNLERASKARKGPVVLFAIHFVETRPPSKFSSFRRLSLGHIVVEMTP